VKVNVFFFLWSFQAETNTIADIIHQQPRLVASSRRFLSFVRSTQLGAQSQGQIALIVLDWTRTPRNIYACRVTLHLCQQINRPLLLSQYRYNKTACSFDFYPQSTSLDPLFCILHGRKCPVSRIHPLASDSGQLSKIPTKKALVAVVHGPTLSLVSRPRRPLPSTPPDLVRARAAVRSLQQSSTE